MTDQGSDGAGRPTVFVSYSHKDEDDCWVGGLKPHLARLHLSIGTTEDAREALGRVRNIIEETGYFRRQGDLAELEAQLAAAEDGNTH